MTNKVNQIGISSNRRLGDIIAEIEELKLKVRPFFQRRLIWTPANKERFLDTVLNGLPFPEIFIATGALNLKTARRENWLVDGQQRITTLLHYVRAAEGVSYSKVRPYSALSEAEQTAFLDYEATVRDLGTIGEDQIKDIFQRINSTDYALKSMEKLHAMFNGKYSRFCEDLAEHKFFQRHNVFSDVNRKRMYDVSFCVILVTTLLCGYYRRDEMNRKFLERYNDEFSEGPKIKSELEAVFKFLDACNLPPDSRAWRKTDLFTLLVECHSSLVVLGRPLDPEPVGRALDSFYRSVDALFGARKQPEGGEGTQIFRYLKAATKATNDKYARLDRAEILQDLISNVSMSKGGSAATETKPARPKAPAAKTGKGVRITRSAAAKPTGSKNEAKGAAKSAKRVARQ